MAVIDDALSDVLRLVRLRAVVYFVRDMAPGWGMDIPVSVNGPLHMVLEGTCVLRVGGRDVALSTGDAVLLPRGTAHAMLDDSNARPQPGPEVMRRLQVQPAPMPPPDGSRSAVPQCAATGTRMLCGHFEWDGTLDHPLFADLPQVIVVRNVSGREGGALFSMVVGLITAEQRHTAPGAAAVADRMGEVLFVSLLRCWIADHAPRRGVLATMSDARLSRALSHIHQNHAASMDVRTLARVAGMSRTGFAVRFHALMGMPPRAYLTEWRMLQARRLLTRTDLALGEIGESVGYGSHTGFGRAFKRRFGLTPARLRREVGAETKSGVAPVRVG